MLETALQRPLPWARIINRSVPERRQPPRDEWQLSDRGSPAPPNRGNYRRHASDDGPSANANLLIRRHLIATPRAGDAPAMPRAPRRPRPASSAATTVPSTPAQRRTASTAASTRAPSTASAATPRPPPSRRTRASTAATATATATACEQPIVCAVAESRGVAPTVGMAFVNLATAEAALCQVADSQTFVKTLHKLLVFAPSELLLCAPTPRSTLRPVLDEFAAVQLGAQVRDLHRKYWDEARGMAYVQQLALQGEVELELSDKFYAVCCFAAVMKYIETTHCISFALHSMRIKYEPSEGAMMIDVATIQALELIQNSQKPRSPHCLLGLLDQTLTKMGARLLRSSILQPLVDRAVIEKRYDALDELTSRAELFVAVRKALKVFQDVDRTLTNMVIIDERPSFQHSEQSINNVLAVKHYVHAVPAVYEALEGVTSELLVSIRQLCAPDTLIEVVRLIDDAINEDVTFQSKPIQLRNQRVYAVKAGVNGLLDVARQAYREAHDDVYQHMLELQRSHEINLEMRYDAPRQSYFAIRANTLTHRTLPDVFINQFHKKNVVECQTLGLLKLNQKISDAATEALQCSDAVVQQLVDDIRAHVAPLFRISDGIAVLDMLGAFAHVAANDDYVRPELTSDTLALQAVRHPVAAPLAAGRFVANDVFAPPSRRLQLVTGCNMSGKSTLLRTIALVVVLAQLGSFVPAVAAAVPPRHQLFARAAADDSGTAHVSTFATEMREAAFILRHVDARALVLVDELGRGTAARDGLAIAAAVAEALAASRALVWFVTHFSALPPLLAARPGVATLHLRTAVPRPGQWAMLYTAADGAAVEPRYGLSLARAVGLPADVLREAERVAAVLEARAQLCDARPPAAATLRARRRKLLLALREQLENARDGQLADGQLRDWLASLQVEFVRRMAAIDADEQSAAPGANALDRETSMALSERGEMVDGEDDGCEHSSECGDCASVDAAAAGSEEIL